MLESDLPTLPLLKMSRSPLPTATPTSGGASPAIQHAMRCGRPWVWARVRCTLVSTAISRSASASAFDAFFQKRSERFIKRGLIGRECVQVLVALPVGLPPVLAASAVQRRLPLRQARWGHGSDSPRRLRAVTSPAARRAIAFAFAFAVVILWLLRLCTAAQQRQRSESSTTRSRSTCRLVPSQPRSKRTTPQYPVAASVNSLASADLRPSGAFGQSSRLRSSGASGRNGASCAARRRAAARTS
eukprot:1403566-Pleurochrysis_carterae.AAC.2